jgi:uncharacterized membrane protein
MKRISSIDYVRGFVMIIMALDHTRDLIHYSSISQSPTNLATTTPALFFTRWITHICAPTFVFLSGTSAFLSFKNTNNFAASRRFLLTRGLWLLILEFTLVNFAIWFDVHFAVLLFEVIATIGVGFIVLGLSLKASPKTLGIIGLVIIFCHNLSPLIPFSDGSVLKRILMLLFGQTSFPLSAGTTFLMGYPPVPWLGIMLVGFACGKFFEWPESKRRKLFLRIGITSLLLFALVRFINIYGDSVPWSKQQSGMYTILSFMNITKYPPSLVFCLCMLGIMFLLLYLFEGINNSFTRFLNVYGKVPLFYFIVHFYVIHIIMFMIVFMQGYSTRDMVFGFNFGRPKPGSPSGVGLVVIYLIWIGVVLLMYPLCKWYGNFKERHREIKWLRYL